jgi:tetratricopeptide (TPR) repeat protein
MAGAFDFYVDESLLEQLLGGGGSTKAKKDGPAKPSPSPVPAPAEEAPAIAVEASAASVAPGLEPEKVAPEASPVTAPLEEAPVSADPVPEMAVAQPDPSLAKWIDADRFFAQADFAGAASAYRDAAQLAESDATRASTLFYNAGVSDLSAGHLDSARQMLCQSLERAPESRTVRLALAQTCLKMGQSAEAAESFDQVLAAAPADEDALLGKIQALCGAQDYDGANEVCAAFRNHHPQNPLGFEAALAVAAARKDRAAVEQWARELLQVQPQSKTALKVLAAVAIAQRDYASAAGYCESLLAIGQDPDFETCLHASETFQNCERFEQAIEAARRAVAQNPDSFEALLRLAESQQKVELWEEARENYQKAVAIQPNCPDALWNLALIFEQLGALAEAADTLTAAVRMRPDWQDASLRLASLQAASGRLQEASAVLEHCLMLRKDWPEALFLSGIVLHQMGQSGPAQDAVLKALELKPDETSWIESLEQIAVERDDALVALDCHEKLADSNIETPEMAYNLGVVLQIENEPELAAKCFVRALEQKPDFCHALLNLGHALRQLGREDEARACWGKAVRLDPTLATGYFL